MADLKEKIIMRFTAKTQWEKGLKDGIYVAEDFDVDETHRFEGMSSTDDNSVLYAISSKDGIKGLLVDAYGVYAENISEAMRRKLR